MKCKWLIHETYHDLTYKDFYNTVKSLGYDCKLVKTVEDCDYDDKDCVLYWGEIKLARQIMKEKKWIPTIWLTSRYYDCTYYYSLYGKYLLNENYIILPRSEVRRRVDWLYDQAFGCKYESLFFRPNSGMKTFDARVIDKINFDYHFCFTEMFSRPEDLVIISTPKNIVAEYRFICADNKIISGCTYALNGEHDEREDYPQQALKLAEEIASLQVESDPMFTIDIALDSLGDFHLIEINSFCCAGMYLNNLNKVIIEASNIAEREWREYND